VSREMLFFFITLNMTNIRDPERCARRNLRTSVRMRVQSAGADEE